MPVIQQKIPCQEVIDKLPQKPLETIINNLDKYICDGWSIPHSEASRGMRTDEFIKIIWEVINKTHTTNYAEILREIHRWMPTRPLLQYKSITSDGVLASDLGVNVGSPINRHMHSFNSKHFDNVHSNILRMFSRFNTSIKKGDYYIIEDSIIFVVNDEKPSWDKTDTIEKLYNLIIYNKSHIIGQVTENGPKNMGHDESFICVEEVDGNKILIKCLQSGEIRTDTRFMVSSVRLLNKDKNTSFHLENTKIAVGNDSNIYDVMDATGKSFDTRHSIYYMANGFPITEKVARNVEFPKYFGHKCLDLININPLTDDDKDQFEKKINRFINYIPHLFHDSNKITEYKENWHNYYHDFSLTEPSNSKCYEMGILYKDCDNIKDNTYISDFICKKGFKGTNQFFWFKLKVFM